MLLSSSRGEPVDPGVKLPLRFETVGGRSHVGVRSKAHRSQGRTKKRFVSVCLHQALQEGTTMQDDMRAVSITARRWVAHGPLVELERGTIGWTGETTTFV
jgi:hypothetical protein